MGRNTEIVVRAPDSDGLLAPRIFFGEGKTLSLAQNFLEDAVRMIFLLFGDLLVEEIVVGEESALLSTRRRVDTGLISDHV